MARLEIAGTSDETILYLIGNEQLGWRKIGVGFGSRIEKWRREGWVLEQQVLFPTREDALLAESMVKRQLKKLPTNKMMPDEGSTEMWPYEWGTFDLAEVGRHTTTYLESIQDLVGSFDGLGSGFIVSVINDFAVKLTVDSISDEEREEIKNGFDGLLVGLCKAISRLFIEEESHLFDRETVERFGLNWTELVKKRQEYWEFKGQSFEDSSSPTNDDSDSANISKGQ